ncbi:hypothetical protein HI914_04613 [Erysiphe necator]|nr:hypothetical protein HI914_04613 [Erysiphe necator]
MNEWVQKRIDVKFWILAGIFHPAQVSAYERSVKLRTQVMKTKKESKPAKVKEKTKHQQASIAQSTAVDVRSLGNLGIVGKISNKTNTTEKIFANLKNPVHS